MSISEVMNRKNLSCFISIYICVCVIVSISHVCVGTQRPEGEVLDSLELGVTDS